MSQTDDFCPICNRNDATFEECFTAMEQWYRKHYPYLFIEPVETTEKPLLTEQAS